MLKDFTALCGGEDQLGHRMYFESSCKNPSQDFTYKRLQRIRIFIGKKKIPFEFKISLFRRAINDGGKQNSIPFVFSTESPVVSKIDIP